MAGFGKVAVRAPVAAPRPAAVAMVAPRPVARIPLNPPPPVITKAGPLPIKAAAPIVPVRLPIKEMASIAPTRMNRPITSFTPPNAINTPQPATQSEPSPQPERYVQSEPAPAAAAAPSTEEEQRDDREDSPQEEYRGEREYERAETEESDQESSDEEEEAVEDEHTYDGDSFEGEPQLEVPLVSSHVHRGIMHTAAITFAPHGASCIVSRVHCPQADQEGIVNFAGENPPWLDDGIARTAKALLEKAKLDSPEKEIGSLVRRARAGDQNAMGIIAMVRTRASQGDETARRSARLMHDYIRRHPVSDDMGAELDTAVKRENEKSEREKLRSVIVLANGAPLTKTMISHFLNQLPDDKLRKLFVYGLIRFKPSEVSKELETRLDEVSKSVLDVGRTVGEARAIQMVRLPGSSISKFDPIIGWELGE